MQLHDALGLNPRIHVNIVGPKLEPERKCHPSVKNQTISLWNHHHWIFFQLSFLMITEHYERSYGHQQFIARLVSSDRFFQKWEKVLILGRKP